MKPHFPRPEPINLGRQLASLQRFNPVGVGVIGDAMLVWNTEIYPTPLSRSYRTRIEYELNSAPQVRVVAPLLAGLSDGRIIPHLYSQKQARLCLYRPGYREWAAWKFLSQTIIPWAALWLFCFEEWLLTGEWKGGGEHPPTED